MKLYVYRGWQQMVQTKMYRVTIMGYSVISDTIGVQRAAVGGGLKK